MAVCALSAWRGRNDDRLAAGALLAAWALSMVVFKARSEETQWGVLTIDTGLLGIYLWVAMRSRRFWPLFVAAFQLLAVVTHIAHALDAGVSGWAYLTAIRVWTYLGLFTIGYGAWTAAQHAEMDDVVGEPLGATRR